MSGKIAPHLPDDGYMSLKRLSAYADMSIKALRRCLVDPKNPLPHYRMAHKILVKKSEFDQWIAAFKASSNPVHQLDIRSMATKLLRAVR